MLKRKTYIKSKFKVQTSQFSNIGFSQYVVNFYEDARPPPNPDNVNNWINSDHSLWYGFDSKLGLCIPKFDKLPTHNNTLFPVDLQGQVLLQPNSINLANQLTWSAFFLHGKQQYLRNHIYWAQLLDEYGQLQNLKHDGSDRNATERTHLFLTSVFYFLQQ
jgi:hypothetical protein